MGWRDLGDRGSVRVSHRDGPTRNELRRAAKTLRGFAKLGQSAPPLDSQIWIWGEGPCYLLCDAWCQHGLRQLQ